MKCPWENRLNDLVGWARNLLARKDSHGRYIPLARRTGPKNVAFTEKSEPMGDVLMDHFSGEAVIGLFVVGPDGCCRMVVVDIDRHDQEGVSVFCVVDGWGIS